MARGKQDEAETQVPATTTGTKPGLVVAGSAYANAAGEGFEGTSGSDYSLPFFGVLQKMSPQVDKDQDAYIPGAEAGQIINTVTLDRFPGNPGMIFVPVHRDHQFVEWVPRDNGGGFVGSHKPESPEVLKAQRDAGTAFGKLPYNGNDLVETFYMYGLRVDEFGNTDPGIIAFSSTGIKYYKNWMTKARGIKLQDPAGRAFPAPIFSHRYRLATFLDENKKGKFHSWRITFDSPDGSAAGAYIPEDSALGQEVMQFRQLILRGAVKIDLSKQHQEGESDSSSDDF